jgi:hypothetical protein
MSKFVVSLIALLSFSFVHAEQCTDLSRGQAEKAMELLADSSLKRIQYFCELCGDSTPKDLVYVNTSIIHFNNGAWGIRLNEQTLDSAYIYIAGKNLAMQLGCFPEQVSPELAE